MKKKQSKLVKFYKLSHERKFVIIFGIIILLLVVSSLKVIMPSMKETILKDLEWFQPEQDHEADCLGLKSLAMEENSNLVEFINYNEEDETCEMGNKTESKYFLSLNCYIGMFKKKEYNLKIFHNETNVEIDFPKKIRDKCLIIKGEN